MKLSMIAAMDQNNAIGKNNELPWRLPADLANFKALTSGKLIIMGRKTWESLGCRPLPNRKTLVISRSADEMEVPDGVLCAKSIPEVMKFVTNAVNDEAFPEEVFVIGGAEIYHQFMPYANTIYLSRIDLSIEGADAFFPNIDRETFQVDYTMTHLPDGEKHTHRWTYQILNRIAGAC